MSKELVIGSNRHETKVAVLEDDQLVEVYFQRANEYSLAGSIHKGRVTRVLPGMQSAFVDLGLERDTFLYVSDFFEEHPDIDTVPEEKTGRSDRGESRSDRRSERQPERNQAAEASRPAVAGDDVFPAAIEAPPADSSVDGAAEVQATGEQGEDTPRERRGRRSRRRRSRGRGFPDTKYAQPAAIAATQAAEDAGTVEEEPADEAETSGSGVLVLPGESLAKYRHPANSIERERETERFEAAGEDAETSEFDEFSEPSENPNLEISAAAEPTEAPIAEYEAPVAAQEQNVEAPALAQPGPEAKASPTKTGTAAAAEPPETDTEGGQSAEANTDSAEESDQAFQAEELAESIAAEVAEQLKEADPASVPELIEVDLAGEDGDEGTTVVLLDTNPGEEQEAAEAHDSTDDASTGTAESDLTAGDQAAGSEAGDQSASVREQGGRYMHRMSRRTRRRRNRVGQHGPANGPEGAATAAAPALTTEPRPAAEPSEREERETKALRPIPSITDLLKPGQEIIVQIAKEPLGQKGARITSHVALPGRFVVYMPSVEHLGVSRKIASDEERHRLKKILLNHRTGTTGGFIVRTAGEGHSEEEIAADMNFLYNLWLDIRQKAEKLPAPALLHHDLDIVQRILRDQLTDEFKAIWADSEEMYEKILSFVQRFQPALVSRVKMYTRQAPIFDAFNITQELEKALRPKVWLKSGGYIVINQTEALVAIDVNTGKFVGKSNRLEDTIVKTNLEAVKEIVRQVRLRDLGGIIVVDFIDMDERKNRQKVMQALEDAMRADKAPYKILQFNDFGLVAITRKRVKQSLERTLCAPCPYCEGAGYLKSSQTVISEILVEAQKLAAAIEGKDVMLRCHPEVAKVLKSRDNQYLEELEEILGRPVIVTSDPQIHLQKFDLV